MKTISRAIITGTGLDEACADISDAIFWDGEAKRSDCQLDAWGAAKRVTEERYRRDVGRADLVEGVVAKRVAGRSGERAAGIRVQGFTHAVL